MQIEAAPIPTDSPFLPPLARFGARNSAWHHRSKQDRNGIENALGHSEKFDLMMPSFYKPYKESSSLGQSATIQTHEIFSPHDRKEAVRLVNRLRFGAGDT